MAARHDLFGGRGHIEGSYEYRNDAGVSRSSSRDFLRGDYDISDSVHAYLQGTFNSKFNSVFTPGRPLPTPRSAQDAYLAPAYQAQLATADQPTFTMSKQMMDAPRAATDMQSRQFFVNGGLDGTIGQSVTWDVGFAHNNAKLDQIACRANVVSGSMRAACRASRSSS